MSWEKVALSEVADFSNGINFDKSAYSSGVKLIGVSNFGNRFSPDYDELQEIDAKVVRAGDYLTDGDIVFVRSNGNKELVGRCMLIKEPKCAVTYSGFCIRARIKDTNKYNPTFFAYYFKSKAFRKALSGNAIGANIQNLSQGRLANHIACVPGIDVQKKIASILSAYDDLIENNQKQIKLLEEAAQRLYKEWFVDLRFPGHETTPITDGIPQGWSVHKIGERFDTYLGGTPSRAQLKYWQDGTIPWINSGKVNELRVIEPSEYITELALKKSATKMLPIHTTLVAITGATLGQVSYTEIETCANQSVVGIVDPSGHFEEYIYCYVSSNIKRIISKATGGAQQHINKDIVNAFDILLPSDSVAVCFKNHITPLFEKIKDLLFQNILLVEVRDRLLPKLMNGEIEV